MEKRGAEIDAVLPGGIKNIHPEKIDRQPQGGDDEHGHGVDLGRLKDTPVGLIKDIGGHGPEGQAVEQGHQDFQAVVTVSLLGGGRLGGPAQGQETQTQGRHVAEHVARVRQQGQAVGEEAPHQFHDEKDELRPESQGQTPGLLSKRC